MDARIACCNSRILLVTAGIWGQKQVGMLRGQQVLTVLGRCRCRCYAAFHAWRLPVRSKRAELEARLVAEELERRVAAHVEERVAAVLGSEAVQRELQQRLERERKAIEEQVRDPRTVNLPSSCPMCQSPSGPQATHLSTCPRDDGTHDIRLSVHSVRWYRVRSLQALDGCWRRPFSQVERELQVERERAAREEEARREAIRAQQQELQQLEDERRKEVGASNARSEQAAANRLGCLNGREYANHDLSAEGWLIRRLAYFGTVEVQVHALGMVPAFIVAILLLYTPMRRSAIWLHMCMRTKAGCANRKRGATWCWDCLEDPHWTHMTVPIDGSRQLTS